MSEDDVHYRAGVNKCLDSHGPGWVSITRQAKQQLAILVGEAVVVISIDELRNREGKPQVCLTVRTEPPSTVLRMEQLSVKDFRLYPTVGSTYGCTHDPDVPQLTASESVILSAADSQEAEPPQWLKNRVTEITKEVRKYADRQRRAEVPRPINGWNADGRSGAERRGAALRPILAQLRSRRPSRGAG